MTLICRVHCHLLLLGAAWEGSCARGWHRGAMTWDTALFAQTSVNLANASVVACVSAASPVLSLNATHSCSTGRRHWHLMPAQ